MAWHHICIYRWDSSQRHQRVFVIDLRLTERRCLLDEVEQASVKLIKDWGATSRSQHILPVAALSVDGVMVDPVTSVCDLGIYIYADLSHENSRAANRVVVFRRILRQLRQISKHIPPDTFQTLVAALVLSRLDYGNGVLIGLSAYLVCRLHSSRYLMRLHVWSFSYVALTTSMTPLASLHYMAVRPGAHQVAISLLAYTVLQGTAPRYLGRARPCVWFTGSALSPLCQHWSPVRAIINQTMHALLATEHFRSLLLRHGTLWGSSVA